MAAPQRHEGAVKVREACTDAIKELFRLDGDGGLINADDVVGGLVDTLAVWIAGSPYAATIGGRDEFTRAISKALKDRVVALQTAKLTQTGLISALDPKAN